MARIYLASPYTHDDPQVRKERVQLAEAKAIELMQVGNQVFSPVAHSGRLVEQGCVLDDSYWYDWSFSFLEHWAEILAYYRIAGFRQSKGMPAEWDWAYKHKMPIIYL